MPEADLCRNRRELKVQPLRRTDLQHGAVDLGDLAARACDRPRLTAGRG